MANPIEAQADYFPISQFHFWQQPPSAKARAKAKTRRNPLFQQRQDFIERAKSAEAYRKFGPKPGH